MAVRGSLCTFMRFGLGIAVSTAAETDPAAVAQRAEELGFDFVSSSDHPAGTTPTNEAWTMLCFVAAATSRIHVASRVLGVPYRSPALLAKMAETLDRLSNGRLILGLGGGSADDEHRQFGLGVRSPAEKTTGLEEAVTIVRGLWTQASFSFDGRLYRVEAAEVEPKPRRAIPIWLGTFAPRALAVTGRLADGWIPSLGYMRPDELPAMRERVLASARAAGRDPAKITCALNLGVRLGRAVDDPSVVSGTAARVADELRRFAAAGFVAFNFLVDQRDRDEQTEQLATEVLPLLREG